MAPTQSRNAAGKTYTLYILAIALLVFGGAAFFLGMHSFVLRSVGIIAVIGGTHLVRLSNVHSRPASSDLGAVTPPPSRRLWLVGLALAAAVVAAYVLLYLDALGGYREVAPVYIFAGVAAVCTVVWAYLLSRNQ